MSCPECGAPVIRKCISNKRYLLFPTCDCNRIENGMETIGLHNVIDGSVPNTYGGGE